MRRHSFHQTRGRQRGVTLVIAMLILVLIMMIGVTTINTSNIQYKMAANLQFEDSAVNNAETAIAAAESWLSRGSNYSDSGFAAYARSTTPHLIPIGYLAALPPPANSPMQMTWSDGNSVRVGCIGNPCAGGNPAQRYFIEQLSTHSRLAGSSAVVGARQSAGCNVVNTYLITGRGQSARGAIKFVQSFFSVSSCPAA